ncbi:MFS transporter [Parafrankia soli]|uniref:MFS transporter n=1 Tax=Parafrankia soli TaxID=2599596 RepID=UPI003B8499C7
MGRTWGGAAQDDAAAVIRDRRWGALILLCAAQLMIFVDAAVVNVALSTIQRDLHISPASLSWVVNAYLLTFGGFLLLAGRAGDLFDRRRLFVAGMGLFTAASLLCAVATSPASLIAGRALQGVGGALVAAVSLTMIVTLFGEPVKRDRAMAVYSFVASGGGTLGVIFGGVLIDTLGWYAIFLINLPIGLTIIIVTPRFLGHGLPDRGQGRLDLPGAVTVTTAVMLALLGCVTASSDGWAAPTTLILLAAAAAGLTLFVHLERRAPQPLLPPRLFRSRALCLANTLAVLLRAAMFSWFYFAALYMQNILGFTPLQTGLGFLPATLIIAVCAYMIAARLVARVGVQAPIVGGAALIGVGLAAFALSPADGTYPVDVLPGMVLLGFGGGILFMPLIRTATTSTSPQDAGAASGLLNTSQQLGGALGLAVLASLAATHRSGDTSLAAIHSGYQLAFLIGAALAATAAILGLALRPQSPERRPVDVPQPASPPDRSVYESE